MLPELAVVDAGDVRKVVGSLAEAALREAYNRETLSRDLAGGMTSRVNLATRGQPEALGGNYVLAELEVPHRYVG